MKPNSTLEKILQTLRKFIPRRIFLLARPVYHYLLALTSAILYRFPSKKINIVAVTGTKGKTSTSEILNAILEEAGYKTALAGTLRFKIGDHSERNLYKMTIPGRFFLQKFLRRAVDTNCDWVIVEMTSEGAKVFRHKFIEFNALVFTNLSPEHIESHGSFENYKKAKLSIAEAISTSSKRPRIIIANNDDPHAKDFLAFEADIKTPYTLNEASPYTLEKNSTTFTLEKELITTHLPGLFNLSNILAGVAFSRALKISPQVTKNAILKLNNIRGRVERVDVGQDFDVIVDYAHTADSLEKLYNVFSNTKKICVLGGTGGGRDRSKRTVMGEVADRHCDYIVLTDEDPYDENPTEIINDITKGIKNTEKHIILDRREAIAHALKKAEAGSVVLITGKGTDPYIMGPNGTKTPWDDATVAREELTKIGFSKK